MCLPGKRLIQCHWSLSASVATFSRHIRFRSRRELCALIGWLALGSVSVCSEDLDPEKCEGRRAWRLNFYLYL